MLPSEKEVRTGKKVFALRRDLNDLFKIGQTIDLWQQKNHYTQQESYKFGEASIIDINPIEINSDTQKIYLGSICINNQIPLDPDEVTELILSESFKNEQKFWEYYKKHKLISTIHQGNTVFMDSHYYKMINFKLIR